MSEREWQPIETAPRAAPGHCGPYVLVWMKWGDVEIGRISRFTNTWYTRGGRSIEPTWWQPLPAPPPTGSETEGE